MIISCPACGASFNIKVEALGPNGRTVKCSKCAHRWRATADEDAQDADAPVASDAAPNPAPSTAAAEPAPETAAKNTQESTQESTQEPAPETASAAESGSAAAPPEMGDGGSAESGTAENAPDDNVADAPGPPPGLKEALGLSANDAGDESGARSSRGGRRQKPVARKPRRSMAKVLSFFALLLLISGIGSAAVLLNQKIMTWMPATQRLYALVGIEPQALGQGLRIVEPTPKKEIDGNDEILVVEGEIRNTTGDAIDIPLMRGALLDKQGQELHTWTFTAAKSRIAPGELAKYRTEFRNPPPLAQSLDITFTRSNAVLEAATHDVKPEKKPEATPEHSSAQPHTQPH